MLIYIVERSIKAHGYGSATIWIQNSNKRLKAKDFPLSVNNYILKDYI